MCSLFAHLQIKIWDVLPISQFKHMLLPSSVTIKQNEVKKEESCFISTLNKSRGASLLFRQIKINVRTYLPIQSVRGKTCTSLTKITYQMAMWCDVFDEISHILSHSVFLSWISSPSYLTSMFLLLQTSIWQVNRSLIDRRQ